jgi:small ligand-binding sensory domain FIST
MKWASAISGESDAAASVAQVVAAVAGSLGEVRPDLVLLFVSPHHSEHFDGIVAAVAEEFSGAIAVGCSGGGVIANGREIERTPGIALAAGSLPGVSVTLFARDMDELPGGATTDAWRAALGLDSPSPAGLLLFPDPFTFDAEVVLAGLDQAFPGTVKIGGLASGATQPGENALFAGGRVMRSGVVGVALDGDLRVDAVVAQGCRPIGEPMFVTASERNIVRQLDGRPAFEVLRDAVDALSPADLELARHSLFVGLVMRRHRESYVAGDFLVRNVIGVDPDSGVVGVGGLVEEGSVLQFHLRDAATSADDLARMLDQHRTQVPAPPEAVLLFSCLGRGEGLYGRPDHDSSLLADRFGAVPIGGFFCNGEIGPVQGRTYLHGYTSSIAMLRRGTR